MTWESVPLSEVVKVRRGHDLPARVRKPGSVPVVSSGGVSGYHDVAIVDGPGVVLGRATNLGQPTWVDGPYWPHNTTLYVEDFCGNNPRWVYWWFKTHDLSGFNSGSVQPMLNRNYIAKVPVRLPPLEEQERIAGVLGAFDDLIETNRHLIESLDQTATHRANQLAKDASGDWLKFADVADIGGGGTPSTKSDEFWGGKHPWATPKDITALPSRYIFDTPRKLTDAGLAKCSSPLRPVGSILMTSRATVGEFALAKVPLAVNQGFIVVNGESPADTTWLYFEMRRRTPEFKTIAAKGSTFPEISRREFRSLGVHWPESGLRQRLHREVSPLLEGAADLEREVASITAHRDELLPLLMSGRVRVRDVEAAVS